MLQSLFTWIFYLFEKMALLKGLTVASFNPYSPGFSIYFAIGLELDWGVDGFNPYSPGFSIYFYMVT